VGTKDRPNFTERVHPGTGDLDRLGSAQILERILDEDAGVAEAVRGVYPELVEACEILHAALESGGRWINAGAGTSGRIGVIDAAEIPPTFGLDSGRVVGLIAGGADALQSAVEGAEDDAQAARRDLEALGLGPRDVLVCLSASGRTPWVLGAAGFARERGARTVGITCSPGSELACAVDLAIAVDVGAEVIAGSTRMKGGLAQKMILHALSTTVMVRLGHVRGNRMAGLQTMNAKLRERALGIVMDLAQVPRSEAESALASSGSVDAALDALGVPRRERP
jgi:N-acetylmuramic acid 6-phosphate etherase